MQHRERERERGKKERKKNQNTTTKKEQRKSNLFDEHVLRHTFYIFFFSPSLKGERKERRGRFDLHNNAQKHTEDTLRAKKKAFVDKTTTRFFTETSVSLRRRTKGRGDSWRARF